MVKLRRVEVSDMRRASMVDQEFQHLIEIAVIQSAIPSDGQGIATHDVGGGSGVEGIGQARHVLIIVAAFDKELQEPADRHVRDRIQPVKLDAVAGVQLLPKLGFDGFLFGRQERANRIVDQVQGEPAVRPAIAESVQQTECHHRFLKNAVASLCIGLAGTVRRKGGDNFDLVVSQEFREIRLGRKQQHGQITAIHHMSAKPAGLFDEPAKMRIELRRAACDINCGNVRLGQRLDALLGGFS